MKTFFFSIITILKFTAYTQYLPRLIIRGVFFSFCIPVYHVVANNFRRLNIVVVHTQTHWPQNYSRNTDIILFFSYRNNNRAAVHHIIKCSSRRKHVPLFRPFAISLSAGRFFFLVGREYNVKYHLALYESTRPHCDYTSNVSAKQPFFRPIFQYIFINDTLYQLSHGL